MDHINHGRGEYLQGNVTTNTIESTWALSTTFDRILAVTRPPSLDRARARPFLKWAGGKRTLVPEIAKLLPDTINTYWEPFLGGGAVFFALDGWIRDAKLSDVNAELALTYQTIRNQLDALLARLQEHEGSHADTKYYYRVRKTATSPDAVEVAARLIYLNKTCYNGLYRVNKSGLFNVPRGEYKNPAICDTNNLRAVSEALQKAVLKHGDFSKVKPSLGDFIYCDPPYDGTFARYGADGFGEPEQRRLRDTVLKWQRLGAAVMVSNADTPFIRSLYPEPSFTIHQVSAPRDINCKGNGRGPTAGLLITAYA